MPIRAERSDTARSGDGEPSGARPARRRGAAGLLASLALAVSTACGSTPESASQAGADPAAAHAGVLPSATSTASAEDRERGGLLSRIRQLTFEGRRSGEGYYGRDGRQIVFQSEREPGNPFYQIYRMDLRLGTIERVSPGVGKTTCGWLHPGGRRVLFASTHADPRSQQLQREEIEQRESGTARRYAWDYDENFDLYVADVADVPGAGPVSAPRALAPARGYDAEGAYSPDGRWIVFASNRHAYDEILRTSYSPEDLERLERDPSYFVDLYLMDAQGREIRRLTTSPGYDGGPFFSPDGERVVWRRFGQDGKTAEVFSIRVDGSDERQLTRLGALSWAPFYHSSGDYVVFATNLQGYGNFELYAVDAAGEREPVRVTHTEGFDGLPAFSPDGATLVWTSQRTPDRSSQLFTASWDDAGARRLLGLEPATGARARSLLPVPETTQAEITEPDLRAHVEALTSDPTDGRRTGTPGERIATGYLARVFRAIGLEPAGDAGGFFEEFEFTAGVSLGSTNRMETTSAASGGEPTPWQVDRDWRPLAFSRVGEVEAAPVVFAGYGLVAPAGVDAAGVDEYGGADVTDRWVLMLRYVPEGLPADRKRHLRRYAGLRHKAMIARDRGARGILLASGPTSQVRSELPPLSFDASLAETSIAVVAITDELADALLAGSGRDLEALQAELDGGASIEAFELPEARVSASIDLVQQKRIGRNVIGRLSTGAEPSEEVVMIGAHVDHLGRGPSEASLARDADPSAIHRGADDNASGVAVMIEIAEALSARAARGELELKRDLVFAAWSGEELGLLGSNHHVATFANPHVAPENASPPVAAYLNLDMVGRLERAVSLYGVGSSPVWSGEIERANLPIALPIDARDDSYLPTDATPFYLAGVPILSAFTGAHEDYHTPGDVEELLVYPGMRDIGRLFLEITLSLANAEERPTYLAAPAPENLQARSGLRVYLGTIPDYARSDIRGVRISGVSTDGPAQQAGLRAGDVIVRVGDRGIENIYDYTFALGDLAIGEPVDITVRRDGAEEVLRVVPGSRE